MPAVLSCTAFNSQFSRVSAQPSGLWPPALRKQLTGQCDGAGVQRNDVLLYEVMVDSVESSWSTAYRLELEASSHISSW
jgi:hypothetical protein